MWITDVQSALNKIFEIYGLTCCIDKIEGYVITMTNFDQWLIFGDGDIRRLT